MIPEDSMLRRHYLTELKYKQQAQFEDFTSIALTGGGRGTKVNILPDFPEPTSDISISHFFVAGLIVMVLIFLL